MCRVCIFFAVLVAWPASTAVSDVVQSGLLGYWTGDGVTLDFSGNEFHGTSNNGLGFTDGIDGMAFDFDGVDDWIDTSLSLTNDQSFTVSAWVKWDGHTGAAFQEIVSWWNLSDPIINRTFLGVAQGSQGPLRFGDAWTGIGVNLPTQEWVHLAATYNGVSNDRQVFLNGALVAEQLAGPEARFSSSLAIGRQGELNGEFWNGAIDDLAIYDRELTTQEIQFNASVPEPSAAAILFLIGASVGLRRLKRSST